MTTRLKELKAPKRALGEFILEYLVRHEGFTAGEMRAFAHSAFEVARGLESLRVERKQNGDSKPLWAIP